MLEPREAEDFTHFGLHPRILHDIARLGYRHPTPIQARCIPQALAGRDVIGLAQTGTGKTAAFGLPILQRGMHREEMFALVLAPTRELAQQIAAHLRELGHSVHVRVAVVVGGVPIEGDYRALRAWPTVLVATPGRLIDHIHSRTVSLSEIETVVVDEADRMFDMGFMPQIEAILEVLPPRRQTLMYTATMPAAVEKLVRRHMRDPVRIQVGLTAPPRRAEQRLYAVHEGEKTALLLHLLDRSEGRVLVFVRTKRKVDRLASAVSRRHRVGRLHGDREQAERDAAMAAFRNGTCRTLIATDIAARGLDVADIEHVINYDFPRAPEDYVHRIGRTARAAASGVATSFVTSLDHRCLAQVERLIGTRFKLLHAGTPPPPRAAWHDRAGGHGHAAHPSGHASHGHAHGPSPGAPRRRPHRD